ncbi:hypothetical protein GCM10010335_34840 [Streptomyces galbus]|nr:hypothetical protein GCM10010335_34840 [Streptomyces galbus]
MCGAADVFSAMSIAPQVVSSFIVYFADLSMDIAGSFFQVCVATLPAAGFSHGSFTALGVGAVDALALALSSESSFMTPVVYSARLPTRTTPSTDAITEVRTFAFRRASVRRCCCRKNFSRAS